MRYTVRLLCLDDKKHNIEHNVNDYDQAQHFFREICMKILKGIETDIHTWELTLWINPIETSEKLAPQAKYYFSKT